MNELLLKFTKFAEDNNPLAISNSMLRRGYVLDDNESISSKLYKIFAKNREDFISILREAGYNKSAGNWTTDTPALVGMKEASNKMRETKGLKQVESTNEETAKNWFNDVLDSMVGGTDTTTTNTQTINEPATGAQTKTIFVAIGAFVIVGVIIYFVFKK